MQDFDVAKRLPHVLDLDGRHERLLPITRGVDWRRRGGTSFIL
jgi:hypothetical protein